MAISPAVLRAQGDEFDGDLPLHKAVKHELDSAKAALSELSLVAEGGEARLVFVVFAKRIKKLVDVLELRDVVVVIEFNTSYTENSQ